MVGAAGCTGSTSPLPYAAAFGELLPSSKGWKGKCARTHAPQHQMAYIRPCSSIQFFASSPIELQNEI